MSALLILNSLPKTSISFWQGADRIIKKAQYDNILRFLFSISVPCQKELKIFGNEVVISKTDNWRTSFLQKSFLQ